MVLFWIIVAVLFCVIFYFVFRQFYDYTKGDENKISKLSVFQRIKAKVPMELVIWISFAILAGILAVAKWADLFPSSVS